MKYSRLILLFVPYLSALAAEPAPAPTPKLGALLQSWAYNDTTAATTKFNFRLRRAEIKLAGTVDENARWFIMIDPAKNLSATGDNKVLQDLGVAFGLAPNLEIVIGQVKIPTTAEGLDPSGELLFPERSLVARTYGDRRDPGAMLTWKDSLVRVSAMISNGQRANVDDTNNAKELNLRAEVAPMEGTKFGVFTTAGDYSYGLKSRFGVNARTTVGSLLLKGEGVVARDNGVGAHGWTADAAYTVTDRLQPAFRWDTLDVSGVNSHAATLGLNYYLQKNAAKIQLAHTWLEDLSGTNGTYVAAIGTHGSLFIASFQAAL